MKILHLISSGGMYGAEAVILNLMRVLRSGRHECALGVFLNAAQPNVQLYERAVAEGLETHAIECSGPLDRAVPGRIRELVRQTGADVVHAHGYKADVYLYAALRGQPVTIVSTCHTWYDNDLAVRLYGMLDRFVLRSYARVASVSREVERQLLGAGVRRERVELIRNGVDLRAFAMRVREPATGAGLRVGLVGRLEREKGVDLFLRAAAVVLGELAGVQFFVAGDGPDRGSLEGLIGELGVGAHVRLIGREEDMAGFYQSLDLLVSASRQEGLPVVLLEGMASGLPIVATRVGAVPDAVRDGKTGTLVTAEDVPALARAILELLRDAEARARMGEAARAVAVEEFSAERMAEDYLRFYERAIGERVVARQ